MRTYRELFRTPEFTPLLVASGAHGVAMVVADLGLATLVYDATGSPLLSALSMFGASIMQVLGATLLLSAADRVPPRAATTGLALLFGAASALQALPGMPVWAMFAILLAVGPVAALGGGVRYGLLNEILPPDGFLLGRSVLNMANGAAQIGGFAVGGMLVVALSPRGALLTGAGLDAVAAAAAWFGLSARPPRAAGRPSARETWRVNRVLWASVPRRYVFLALWVPNGLVVGAEALYVPYAPDHAGILFACAAAGMLVGDTLCGRFVVPRLRERLGPGLRLLLAAPYLVFVFRPPLPLAAVLVVLASVGYAASLLLTERLMALTPSGMSGQALGLHSSGMLAMQGVGAAIAGGIAQVTSPAAAMTIVAAASVGVTLALAPGLRGTVPASAAEIPFADAASADSERKTPDSVAEPGIVSGNGGSLPETDVTSERLG
ncbi:MFS transporter [Yinghuangia aomiensis]|uniref:MFS transporter n=1 Tax=Yinghuangia aomiensis TaxID=676205 RepID=A0ABP9GKV2_9ACTN